MATLCVYVRQIMQDHGANGRGLNIPFQCAGLLVLKVVLSSVSYSVTALAAANLLVMAVRTVSTRLDGGTYYRREEPGVSGRRLLFAFV